MAHDLELFKESQDIIWENHKREMNGFKEKIDIVWDRSNSNERLSKQNRQDVQRLDIVKLKTEDYEKFVAK